MGRVFQRKATHTEYTLALGGTVVVDNSTHRVVSSTIRILGFDPLYGLEVYASKGRLIDVAKGDVIGTFTRARKVNIPGNMG